jgi:3-O-methylgallate 3,4-dioxygenase
MAKIVLGLGTSHGSQVSLTPDWWPKHGELDRKRTRYDELIVERGDDLASELTPAVWQRKYDDVQRAVGVAADELQGANLDAVIVVGDDQAELFTEVSMPAMAIYWGDTVADLPRDMTNVPESRAAAMWAKHGPVREDYPVATELAQHLIERLVATGFDITQLKAQPEGESLGHAFTFVRLRLMGDRVIPIIPVMLNTYFPPNQPTAARCFALGRAIRDAVAAWPPDLRVGVVASGGLSHFVVDEELDQQVLSGIKSNDADALGRLPESKLQSGSSEIKNWIVAAGALGDLNFELIDYVPGYRSAAGTGCGMAFARWTA